MERAVGVMVMWESLGVPVSYLKLVKEVSIEPPGELNMQPLKLWPRVQLCLNPSWTSKGPIWADWLLEPKG